MTETMLHPSRAGSGHRHGAGERGCHGGQLRDLLHPLYGMDPVLIMGRRMVRSYRRNRMDRMKRWTRKSTRNNGARRRRGRE